MYYIFIIKVIYTQQFFELPIFVNISMVILYILYDREIINNSLIRKSLNHLGNEECIPKKQIHVTWNFHCILYLILSYFMCIEKLFVEIIIKIFIMKIKYLFVH